MKFFIKKLLIFLSIYPLIFSNLLTPLEKKEENQNRKTIQLDNFKNNFSLNLNDFSINLISTLGDGIEFLDLFVHRKDGQIVNFSNKSI